MALIGVHVLGAAGQVLSGRLQRLALGAAFRPATAGVQVVSGILAGPANTQGELSLAGTTLTVQAFRAVIQSTLDATAGSYLVPNDAPVSFTTTAQHASQYRRSLVVVRVDDSQVSGVASTATTDRAVLEVLDGGLAASAGATVLPTPAGSWLALGEVLIPPVGQTVTLTPYNPRTGLRGAILPIVDDTSTVTGHAGAPGTYVGQYRDHPTRGLQRWDGTAWQTVGKGGDTDWATLALNSPTAQGTTWGGSAWRVKGGFCVVQLDISYNGTFGTGFALNVNALPGPGRGSGGTPSLATILSVSTYAGAKADLNLTATGFLTMSGSVTTTGLVGQVLWPVA